MTNFTELIDLAAERLGGAALLANDEFFAPKENLLKAGAAVFIEDKYTDRGKWMDGWETRRHREPGHDWCIVKLGIPGIIRGIVVDTSHFKGNYPASCSAEATAIGSDGAPGAAEPLTSQETPWSEILRRSDLQGDAPNKFAIESPYRFTHVRLNIYPDGGVARLRVHGELVPDWRSIIRQSEQVDLAAVEHGGVVIDSSDRFFGSPNNLLLPGGSRNMGDGWETKRRRGPGHDWVVIKLGEPGTINRAMVDTAYFKGNYPESCSIEACNAGVSGEPGSELSAWMTLLPRVKLQADHLHAFEQEINDTGTVTHVRLNIYPDGGIARLRLLGRVSAGGLADANLRYLNALVPHLAEQAFLSCCGSSNWARRMVDARPFASLDELFETSTAIWRETGREDWLQAFASHPRIGESRPLYAKTKGLRDQWSSEEQSSAGRAPEELRQALAEANRRYEARFGHIFIVCATGKNAEEMLGILEERLRNFPDDELFVAAEEQRKITELRLRKLLG